MGLATYPQTATITAAILLHGDTILFTRKDDWMQKEQIHAALGKAGLAHIAPDVERLLLSSIRLKTRLADESTLAVGATQIGGTPDFPPQPESPPSHAKPLS